MKVKCKNILSLTCVAGLMEECEYPLLKLNITGFYQDALFIYIQQWVDFIGKSKGRWRLFPCVILVLPYVVRLVLSYVYIVVVIYSSHVFTITKYNICTWLNIPYIT